MQVFIINFMFIFAILTTGYFCYKEIQYLGYKTKDLKNITKILSKVNDLIEKDVGHTEQYESLLNELKELDTHTEYTSKELQFTISLVGEKISQLKLENENKKM